MPYQKANFVTPSFPGYASGHSTFSRSAADVLAAMTGSPFFPGGLGMYTVPANTYLTFERGPSQSVQLQWGTYFDAADQAGLSRLWRGIHVAVDDFTGRILGSKCGKAAWALAQKYFDGCVTTEPIPIIGQNGSKIRFNTLRGFGYALQSTADLSRPFTNEPPGFVQAVDSFMVRAVPLDGPTKFYRVIRALPSDAVRSSETQI